MTKERKFDIWKNDAVENGFTCSNCEHAVISEDDKKICWVTDDVYITDEDFCSKFKFRKSKKGR